MAWAAVRSKAVVLLLLTFFLIVTPIEKGILWKQRLHQRTETRVCIFPGPD